MTDLPDPASCWPLELARLQAELRASDAGEARDAARGAFWRLLFEALMRFTRASSRGARDADWADLEDIAADKALEMLARAESGAWDLSGRSGGEIAGYVSTAARYGWLDFVRRGSRERRLDLDDSPRAEPAHSTCPGPGDGAESRELVCALRECVSRLPARERRVWFLRAYHEMNSRDIAAHPLVGITAAHVDVVVQRARQALRRCLTLKGHDAADAPPHAFVELWAMLESLACEEAGPARSDGTQAARSRMP